MWSAYHQDSTSTMLLQLFLFLLFTCMLGEKQSIKITKKLKDKNAQIFDKYNQVSNFMTCGSAQSPLQFNLIK
jgi:hypothetical protein